MICSYMSRLSWESHSIESWRWPGPIMTISVALDCPIQQRPPSTNTGWRVGSHDDFMTRKWSLHYWHFVRGITATMRPTTNIGWRVVSHGAVKTWKCPLYYSSFVRKIYCLFVTIEFPWQRGSQITNVFFIVSMNKLLNKQLRCWWFEMLM